MNSKNQIGAALEMRCPAMVFFDQQRVDDGIVQIKVKKNISHKQTPIVNIKRRSLDHPKSEDLLKNEVLSFFFKKKKELGRAE